MGSIVSTARLSAPITRNRIRVAIQHRMNPEYTRKLITALVIDLNKLGINYSLYNESGKRKPLEQVTKEISELAEPDINKCLVNDSDDPVKRQNDLVRIIKMYNKVYGTNIPITRDPLNPSSGIREPHELCNNIINLREKIIRVLTDEPKAQIEEIKKTVARLKTLRESIAKAFRSLRHSDGDIRGEKRQELIEKLKSTVAKHQSILNQMDKMVRSSSQYIVDRIGLYNEGQKILRENGDFWNMYKEQILNLQNVNPDDGITLGTLKGLLQNLTTDVNFTVKCARCDQLFGSVNFASLDQLNQKYLDIAESVRNQPEKRQKLDECYFELAKIINKLITQGVGSEELSDKYRAEIDTQRATPQTSPMQVSINVPGAMLPYSENVQEMLRKEFQRVFYITPDNAEFWNLLTTIYPESSSSPFT